MTLTNMYRAQRVSHKTYMIELFVMLLLLFLWANVEKRKSQISAQYDSSQSKEEAEFIR